MHSQVLPTFIYSHIALVTYVMPRPSFLKTTTAYAFYLKLANNNHIEILDYEYLIKLLATIAGFTVYKARKAETLFTI